MVMTWCKMASMKKKLNTRQSLEYISTLMTNQEWKRNNNVSIGFLSNRKIKAQYFQTGLVVCIEVDVDIDKIAGICLAIAAMAEACDDSIYIENGVSWLQRRYPEKITSVEIELLVKQQITLAEILGKRRT